MRAQWHQGTRHFHSSSKTYELMETVKLVLFSLCQGTKSETDEPGQLNRIAVITFTHKLFDVLTKYRLHITRGGWIFRPIFSHGSVDHQDSKSQTVQDWATHKTMGMPKPYMTTLQFTLDWHCFLVRYPRKINALEMSTFSDFKKLL